MNKYSFNTAYMQARELYGLELTPDEFENLGIIAWGKIGNKKYKLYTYTTAPSKTDTGEWAVELPCNVDEIEAVTTDYEDYQKTSNKNHIANMKDTWIEGYIETRKFNTNPLYSSGKFIKYRLEGNVIKFKSEFSTVNILYKGFIVDEEGLPYLNEKEVDAIASFCAWTDTRKAAIVTRDRALMEFAMDLERTWKNLCTQARIPEYISQNDMDEILNVAASWDRKRFGKSFKPIH